MAQAEQQIGHNQGPVSLDPFEERIKVAFREVEDRINELEVGLQRVPNVIDNDNAGDVSDFFKQVKTAMKDAEKIRKELKQPLDEKGKKVQSYHQSIIVPADRVLKKVSERFDEYDRKRAAEEAARIAEERRKAAEKEEAERARAQKKREAAEAAAKEADNEATREHAERKMAEARQAEREAQAASEAVNTTSKARVGSIRGAASARLVQSFWDFEADFEQIDLNRLRDYLAQEAIETALRKAIKDTAEGETCSLKIPGVRVFRNQRRITR